MPAHSITWKQDPLYNFAEMALFGRHPIKTARAYFCGKKLDEVVVRSLARRTSLEKDADYQGLIREREGPRYREAKAHRIMGRAYYDARHDETVLRVSAVRMVQPYNGKPYSRCKRKTFAIPGNYISHDKAA